MISVSVSVSVSVSFRVRVSRVSLLNEKGLNNLEIHTVGGSLRSRIGFKFNLGYDLDLG